MPPLPSNNYAVAPTDELTPALWNAVMLSIAERIGAREALEATFEALIADGTQAALDLIQTNVGPQLETLTSQIAALEEQLEEIIGGGTAPNALLLGGQLPAFYLALANATGTLPVAQVSGVDTLIAGAISALKAGVGSALDTLDELAAAIGDDADFAGTVTALVAARLQISQNLADLEDTDIALSNLGGGASGITVFKAATPALIRAETKQKWVTIGDITLANPAGVIDIAGCAGFKSLRARVTSVANPALAARGVRMQFSTDNGATWVNSAGAYAYWGYYANGSAVTSDPYGTATGIPLGIQEDATAAFGGEYSLFLRNGSSGQRIFGRVEGVTLVSGIPQLTSYGILSATGYEITAVRVLTSIAGNALNTGSRFVLEGC